MGITNGNQICQKLCEKSLLFSVPAIGVPVEYEPKPNANLYIDGPILLYCGNIVSKEFKDPMLIIQNKLRKIVSVVASRYNILSVSVFFDGDAPPEKAKRQQQRASRVSDKNNFNIQKVKQEFCEKRHYFPIRIQNLRKGEAEMEMYRSRDTESTSIIYTKDTDMFTIAYGHSALDDVIYCQERNCPSDKTLKVYSFFDMRKFKDEFVPGVVFSALMALAGTDYTDTRLSLTQIECILENADLLQLNDVISDDPNIDEIYTLVDKIQGFLSARKWERRAIVSASRKYSLIREADYLKVVLWYVRYIKNGFGCA